MATYKEQNKLNVPHLRFPEFQGEWEKCKLGDIATLTKGSGISKDQRSATGAPCILYGELYTTYKSEVIDYVVSKTDISDKNLVRSCSNDIIIPSSGETAIDISTARCVLSPDVLLGGDLNIIRLKDGDGRFFSYQLNGVRKHDIAKIAQGVSVVHLYGESIKGLTVSFPFNKEQQKISTLLSLRDERIATQSKLIEDLKKLKAAIIETSFLSEFSKKMEYFSPTIISGKDKNTDGSYPLYGSTGKIGTVSTPSYTTPMVLVARVGSIGTVQYINEPCGVTDNTLILQGDDVEYIYYFLSGFNFKKIISGTTQPLITASSLKAIDVPILKGHKKKALLAILKSLDKKINLESLVENEQRKLKLYILYQMFI